MSMKKYGVSDVEQLQKKELEQVDGRLADLRGSHEKTAAETQEVERLETRKAELKTALSQQ